jgi:hypothetical protein
MVLVYKIEGQSNSSRKPWSRPHRAGPASAHARGAWAAAADPRAALVLRLLLRTSADASAPGPTFAHLLLG